MFDWIKGPIVKRLLTSGVRAALAALTGWLVAKGYASETEATGLAQDLLPIAVALLWSVFEAAHIDQKLETALKLPANSSKDDLKKALDAPQ